LWQERELNSGPSPSDLVVEDGAETHTLRNIALPILKSSSPSKPILPEGWEKALRSSVGLREVASPPGSSSPGSRAAPPAASTAAPDRLRAARRTHAPSLFTAAPHAS